MTEHDASSTQLGSQLGSSLSASMEEFIIPSPLKFLMSNIKQIITIQLNNKNYAIWRLQTTKLFFANGFEGFLTSAHLSPPEPSPDHRLWKLIDHNLVSALFSTISPAILPYILNMSLAQEIMKTLKNRLHPTNRS
ncbi:hypothetical protein KFK09_017829 [Dendrobium nobile]|uniref:Retrotransposon Copia-like N-terminal domain-containing protein n=1 Tax=Dendrobium nobile TaxID=94219 RepID=A0A8T3AT43_DENNO|nr:hypothetical protein KFK09_017829 [Dendrobium nobile]